MSGYFLIKNVDAGVWTLLWTKVQKYDPFKGGPLSANTNNIIIVNFWYNNKRANQM